MGKTYTIPLHRLILSECPQPGWVRTRDPLLAIIPKSSLRNHKKAFDYANYTQEIFG